jgi:hypothetical protein
MSQDKSNAVRQAEFQAAAPSTERWQSKGFARGTLIHTPGGTVPIEMLKAGYMVLSRAPGPGGHTEPPMVKRIAAVRTHDHSPVLRVEYERPGEKGRFNHVMVAPGQPLWTFDKGWIWAGEASSSRTGPSKLVIVSGSTVDCHEKTYLRATNRRKPGRSQVNILYMESALWNYYLHKLVQSGLTHDSDAWSVERYNKYKLPDDFRTTTYSIEVEDHHTHFAGPHGLLTADSTRAGEIAGEQEQHSDHP